MERVVIRVDDLNDKKVKKKVIAASRALPIGFRVQRLNHSAIAAG